MQARIYAIRDVKFLSYCIQNLKETFNAQEFLYSTKLETRLTIAMFFVSTPLDEHLIPIVMSFQQRLNNPT